MDLTERIAELEIKAALQDRTIEELDGVVHEFANRVQVLERALEELRTTVVQADKIGPADEKPPHY